MANDRFQGALGVDPTRKKYGGVGDGVANDSGAFAAAAADAMAARAPLLLPGGSVWNLADGVDLNGSWLVIDGPGARIINESNGNATFRLGHSTQLLHFYINVLSVENGSSAGHIFDVGNGGKHAHWEVQAKFLHQQNPASSILASNFNSSGGLHHASFRGGVWQLTGSHTVPGVHVLASSGVPVFDSVRFERIFANLSGSAAFFYFATSSGTAMEGLVLEDVEAYATNAGVAFFGGCRSSGVEGLVVRGLSTTTAHMLHFNDVGTGGSGADSNNVFVRDYRRIDGTLGSNLYDMQFGTGSQYVVIDGVSDTGAIPAVINLNSRRSVVSGTTANTVLMNAAAPQTWFLDTTPSPNLSLQPNVRTRGLSISRGSSVTISGGEITPAGSFFYVDTEASEASDDLVTINAPATGDGNLIFIAPVSGSRTVVLKHGTGNIRCTGGSDITLDDSTDYAMLFYDSNRSVWVASPFGVA